MLLCELYKIMVNIFTFLGFTGGSPQSPPWIRPCPEFMIKRFHFRIAYLPFPFDVAYFSRDEHEYYGERA